jgi:hypothetical protein
VLPLDGLRKQKLQGRCEFWEGIQREHERLWKRSDEGIQHAGAKFDGRAHELRSLLLWAVKTMEARTWKKQDARRINDDLTRIWPRDLQLSFPEYMEMPGMIT